MNQAKDKLIKIRSQLVRLWWRLKYTFFREKMPKNADGKVYLNLGCGSRTSPEFINIDALPFGQTHLVSDIQNLSMFPDNSVDMIYASHVVEHIPRNRLLGTLKEWRRKLKPRGVLRISVPDFDKLLDCYHVSGGDVNAVVNQLMGQDSEFNRHYSIWNYNYASRIFNQAGFSGKAMFWCAEISDHHNFRDKANRDISLNLEVAK